MKNLTELLTKQCIGRCIRRRGRIVIGDEITEMAVLFLTDRCFQRHGILGDLHNLTNLLGAHTDYLCNLVSGSLVASLLQQLAGYAGYLMDRFHHMHGDTDRSCLIGDSAGDSLADPPGSVSGELISLSVVKLLHGLHKAQITFLDQIEEEHALTDVSLGNAYNQTEVCLHQFLLGALITLGHLLCQKELTVRIQQRHLTDFLQIHTDRIVDGQTFLGEDLIYVLVIFHLANFVFYVLKFSGIDVAGHLNAVVFQSFVEFFQLIDIVLGKIDGFHDIVVGEGAFGLTLLDQISHVYFLFAIHVFPLWLCIVFGLLLIGRCFATFFTDKVQKIAVILVPHLLVFLTERPQCSVEHIRSVVG